MSGAVVASLISAGAGIYGAQQQASAQKKAAGAAAENALKQEKAADEAFNRANKKSADPFAALMDAQKSQDGVGSTMLTGAKGVGGALPLGGANTLLGS